MAQTTPVSQTAFDELLTRINRLEAMVAKLLAVHDVPLVDEQTEEMIAKSFKDVVNKHYTVLHSDEEIEEHFKSL